MTLILSIIICIILVGFFAGIEIAFVSANKLNIEIRKKQGSYSGKVLARFMESPEEFIGTSLVGVNIVLVIYGFLMTEATKPLLSKLPGIFGTNEYIHLALDTIIATIVILILGEFIPKAIFRSKSETLLTVLCIPIQFFYWLLYPIAKFFVSISEFILKYLLNVKIKEHTAIYSHIDLEQFVKQMRTGHDDTTQDVNTELFENALYLSQVKIRECLIPRNEIESIEINTSIDEVKKLFIDTKLSKIVVYKNSIDTIVGYVHQLDFFKNPTNVKSILHQITAVPEAMNAVDLLNQFTKERKSIAWVVDEFGGTAGIVTMEDILEEIFGEIKDEHDTEEYVETQIANDEYILSGRLEIEYLNEKYDLEMPVDDAETLSGFIIENHDSIPKQKENIIIGNYEFDILSVTDTRIETVKMRVLKK